MNSLKINKRVRIDIVYFHDASFIFKALSHDEYVEQNSAFRKGKNKNEACIHHIIRRFSHITLM